MNELEENDASDSHARMVASIERFTGLMLDRVAQTPSGKLMDEKETRMLGSVVMRSYSIWMKALALQDQDEVRKQKPAKLPRIPPENIEKEE